jgi:hypothetical protein
MICTRAKLFSVLKLLFAVDAVDFLAGHRQKADQKIGLFLCLRKWGDLDYSKVEFPLRMRELHATAL